MQPLERSRQYTTLGTAGGCLGGIAVITFGVIFAFVGLSVISGGDWWGSVFAFFGGAAVLGGLYLMYSGFISWRVGTRFAAPQLTVMANSVRVSDTFQLQYQQTFKRFTQVRDIRCILLIHERAVYQQGTSTYTATHDQEIMDLRFTPGAYNAGMIISEERELTIPPHTMHTFTARHNSVLWIVKVSIELENGRKYERAFDLTVAP